MTKVPPGRDARGRCGIWSVCPLDGDLPLLIVFAIGPEGQYLQRSYAIDDRDEKTA